MPTSKSQFTYVIGDRVAERPKTHGIMAVRKETQERIAQYRSQRYGTVLGITQKKQRDGRSIKFLIIQWDHLHSPTEHAQMRICPIRELDRLTKQTIVQGE
jgi:hypothetical protein